MTFAKKKAWRAAKQNIEFLASGGVQSLSPTTHGIVNDIGDPYHFCTYLNFSDLTYSFTARGAEYLRKTHSPRLNSTTSEPINRIKRNSTAMSTTELLTKSENFVGIAKGILSHATRIFQSVIKFTLCGQIATLAPMGWNVARRSRSVLRQISPHRYNLQSWMGAKNGTNDLCGFPRAYRRMLGENPAGN